MSEKYLDYAGLVYFWGKLKTAFAPKTLSTANRAVVTDADKNFTVSSVTSTELGYVSGVTSSIQTQLNGKAASSHGTHVTYSTANPSANGTASPGSSDAVSRGDHVHPLQTAVSGNAGTATKLKTARNIDGMSFDGSAAITHYATCSTAAGTTAKTVTLAGFALDTGAKIAVKFTVTNSGAVASLTLNVNNTGAKSIKYRGANLPSAGTLAANRVYEFIYDGTNYELIGDLDTNTTYSAEKGITLSSGKFGHSNTAITAGSNIGGNTDETPGYNSTFSVPYFSYDAYGHITGSGTKTVKIPASDNTDYRVKQTSDTSTDANIPLIFASSASPTSGSSAETKYSSDLYYNPKTKTLKVSNLDSFATNEIIGNPNGGASDTGGTLTLGSNVNYNDTKGSSGIKIDHSNITIAFSNNIGLPLFGSYGSDSGSSSIHELVLNKSGTFTWDGSNVLTSNNITWSDISDASDKPTTLSGYGITDAKIANGVITLGNNTITPLTAHPTISAGTNTTPTSTLAHGGTFTAITGVTKDTNGHVTALATTTYTLPGSGNTDTKTASTASTGAKLFLIGATAQATTGQDTKSNANCYVGTDNCLYSNNTKVLTSHQSLANYYTKSQIDDKLTSAMHYKGSVDYLQIPSTGAVTGKTYLKKADGTNNITSPAVGDFYNVTEDGSNWAWTGSAWDQTGFAVEFPSITNDEIDTIMSA